MDKWTRGVFYERALLALHDPEGEKDAVSPLTQEQATLNLLRFHPSIPRERRPGTFTGDDRGLAAALRIDPTRHSGRAACPAHGEGQKKTLSYKWAEDGRLLVKCFAGCTYAEIVAAAR